MMISRQNLICKGSDLTEDVAKGLVEGELQTAHMFGQVVFKLYDYNGIDLKTFGWTNNTLESFNSAIESNGYHWGENPEGDQPHNTGLVNSYPTGHALMDCIFRRI